MTKKNITYGKTETGTNTRINLDVVSSFFSWMISLFVVWLLTMYGLTHLVFHQKH